MADFCLSLTDSGGQIKCPKCKAHYYIEWFTEYGDFIAGSHDYECDKCEKVFSFEAEVKYDSWVKGK